MGVFRYAIVSLLVLGAGRAAADEAINKVAFACAGDKTINAAFSPEKVDLTLSDGRKMSLPQAQSASGIRYTNPGEAIVFWSKGNTAFITEGADKKETYAGCIVVAAAPGQNWATFASADEGFSLRFPRSYSVDTSYRYEALGPGKEIGGVSFTVPSKTVTGTNLAADTQALGRGDPRRAGLQRGAISADGDRRGEERDAERHRVFGRLALRRGRRQPLRRDRLCAHRHVALSRRPLLHSLRQYRQLRSGLGEGVRSQRAGQGVRPDQGHAGRRTLKRPSPMEGSGLVRRPWFIMLKSVFRSGRST